MSESPQQAEPFLAPFRVTYEPSPVRNLDPRQAALAYKIGQTVFEDMMYGLFTPDLQFYVAPRVREPDPLVTPERTIPHIIVNYPAKPSVHEAISVNAVLDLNSLERSRKAHRGRLGRKVVGDVVTLTRQSGIRELEPGPEVILRGGSTHMSADDLLMKFTGDRSVSKPIRTIEGFCAFLADTTYRMLVQVTGGRYLPRVSCNRRTYSLVYGHHLGVGPELRKST